jgi:hypothetical protein
LGAASSGSFPLSSVPLKISQLVLGSVIVRFASASTNQISISRGQAGFAAPVVVR